MCLLCGAHDVFVGLTDAIDTYMASWVEYDIVVREDTTWSEVDFTVTINATPLNLTGCKIRSQVRKTTSTLPVLDMSTDNGLIVLKTPLSGVFSMGNFLIHDIKPDDYRYDVLITTADTKVHNWVGGKFTVKPSFTQS